MKDVQVDSVIQADPDETTHLINTGVTSSNKNEINHHHHLKTQLTPKNLKHQCSSLGIA